MQATFAFVDLAGFSALTEVHGDQEAALLLDRFERITLSALGTDDRLVKMIGDAAMICFAAPHDAVSGMKRLIDACMREPSSVEADLLSVAVAQLREPNRGRGGSARPTAVPCAGRTTAKACCGRMPA